MSQDFCSLDVYISGSHCAPTQSVTEKVKAGLAAILVACSSAGWQLLGRVPLGQGLRGARNRSEVLVIQHGPHTGEQSALLLSRDISV